ncbi:hypothetical protein VTN31DRAFT_6595 [Thermomyces dupontii]|uniref:uncharacterized protein n=1 Tax=Talaromyces thermophilus TaxID=28565 RepID=UPI003742B1C3
MEYLSSVQNEIDDLKPSLFELLAEQQLSALLPPSLRYLLAVATHRYPRYLLRALNNFDELYALLSLIVERYYLRTFGGSFTENFYSLKRERVLRTKNGEVPRAQLGAAAPVRETLRLRNRDIWANLAVLVGLPYLKRKLDEGYDIHVAPQASLLAGGGGGPRYQPRDSVLPPNATIKQRIMFYYKWFLRNVYPSVNAAYYFAILAFNLAYLFDSTKYSSPFLWLIGTRIRRLSPEDHRAIAKATQARPARDARQSRPGSGLLGLLSPVNIYPQLLSSLRFVLPVSIFALKFLEWWHASDFSRKLALKATESLDLPAPVVTGMRDPSVGKQEQAEQQDSSISSSSSPQLKPALKRPSSRRQPPISSTSLLPIFTVPPPPRTSSSDPAPCPICLQPLNNPTACQTGYVFCYSCVFRWINGEHERQIAFMSGEDGGAEWEDDHLDGGDADSPGSPESAGREKDGRKTRSREGKWESGKGRCPVTGRRVLGGTDCLRRVLI